MEVQFTVHCPDGAVRHDDPFDSAADAVQFAEWGHACLAGSAHTFSAFTPTVAEWPYRFGIPDRSSTRMEWAVIKAFADGWSLKAAQEMATPEARLESALEAAYTEYAVATEDA